MRNADFGQILCRRAGTKRHVTSRPMVRFRKLGIKRYVRLERKGHEKVCCDLRWSRGSRGFRTGGVKLTPPPPAPVKIGLKDLCNAMHVDLC